ncbi:MAG: hypothetical protein A2283_07535 [Lentisphaerae bacterium RIFOXYA12_FULL_48_11]|nr:MAG: hypothetical protein A2283_07535 [Lentisphaerae bacterium RIFOXYA12_FULL_48_11]
MSRRWCERIVIVLGFTVTVTLVLIAGCKVSPPLKTEDERVAERLEWFQDMKFGFFTHFGMYSQWGCIESWPLVEEDKWARPDDLKAWTERNKDIDKFRRDYWELNKTFNPVNFDPNAWVTAAKDAGMKYFVFTTKHHDGFTMYDTKLTEFSITGRECPFRKDRRADVAKLLFNAFRKEGFGIGAYFSKADWHHPDYWSPDAPAKTRNPNYDTLKKPEKWAQFVFFVHGQIKEIVSRYGRIDILWLDAGQVRPPKQDIQMDKLAAMARSYQPNLLIVDRTVGGKYENYRTPEQQVPPKPLNYVWESCLTMGKQWSYKPNDQYKSVRELIHLLVDVVSKGGNLLLNVGPQPDGQLPPQALERMKAMGAWLKVNGEAIYGTRPIEPYKQENVCLTKKGTFVYAIYLAEEGKDSLSAQMRLVSFQPRQGSVIKLLGYDGDIPWHIEGGQVFLEVPAVVIRNFTGKYAYVFKMERTEL